ncbi:hypothetical protein F5Y13DRAFT_201303 [Hypoxylon sp. FL1857]|nr:hypothetical protein F5Y13DRAFT_201303 [Hypoxylon sp. FL1857]
MADNTNESNSTSERRSRKKRARLSCIECRKKKLSCDRNLPCQRCVRSGRPTQCSFETVAEQPSALSPSARLQEQQIQDLKAEVAKLKALLSNVGLTCEGEGDRGASRATDHVESSQPLFLDDRAQEAEASANGSRDVENPHLVDDNHPGSAMSPGDTLAQNPNNSAPGELLDPKDRSPQGFYSRHALFQFFREVPVLFPFIKETVNEWFKPWGVSISKNKSARSDGNKITSTQSYATPETLIPPKDDTDTLVSFYLNGVEQLHRIVHIPTFRREYADFWIPQRARHPAMTALVLAMISISTSVTAGSTDAASIAIKYRTVSEQWISACEEWLKEQSPKHRRLVYYYQISCLVYLAKRTNMIGKKRWWKETSSLIQDAIIDGLHRDPSPATYTPYAMEMKRRIWTVLRELDLQNAFEYGLPTLLHNIDSDVAPPSNLDDDDFNQTSRELPVSKPTSNYTFSSYQVHSSRSWSLRLEISQRLFSNRLSKDLCYDDVLRYTHEITQAINDIPSWGAEDVISQNHHKLPTLVSAFLVFQLKTCILALHRPYLHIKDGKYWLSETVCYHTSRDILLLNSRLASLGLQNLATLREDLLLASLNLVRITMLQPKGSTSVIMANSQSTIDLLEECVPFIEDMHLRCCYSELWCFITMYAAMMLLTIHLGKETRETAKASCARRFFDLHHRQIDRQRMSHPSQESPTPSDPAGHIDITGCQPPISGEPEFLAFDSNYPEVSMETQTLFRCLLSLEQLNFDLFDFDISMDSAWDIWEPL